MLRGFKNDSNASHAALDDERKLVTRYGVNLLSTRHHSPVECSLWICKIIDSNIHSRIQRRRLPARSCRTFVQGSFMLSKSKGLCSAKFGPTSSLDLCESNFTCRFMLFGNHRNVVLRRTARVMITKERAVASIQDVYFGVG